MLKVTPPGPRGGQGHQQWEFLPATFCPGCGHKGVWVEDSSGDYYVGPQFGCTACDSTGYMWETSGGSLAPHVRTALADAEKTA